MTDAAHALDTVRREHSLETQLEALLIVADEPVSAMALATAVDRPVAQVRAALQTLRDEYAGGGSGDAARTGTGRARGFELREVGGGYRFYVRETLDPLVAEFVQQSAVPRLSPAALETLAVVAYRQPITRGAIASIRAVNVDSVVRTLLGRGLILEVGHDPETGAAQYGTTDALLGALGIGSLDDLPPIAPLLDDATTEFAGDER